MTSPSDFVSPTDAFVDAQRYGALLVLARFTVFQNGEQVGEPYESNMSTGAFTIDRSAEFRRTGNITIEVLPEVPPPLLVPANPQSLLAPFGTEVFIEIGIYSAGNTLIGGQIGNTSPPASSSFIPVGLFVVATSTVDDTGSDFTISLDLYDRAWTIAQRTLENPYNFPATVGGNFVNEMVLLLNTVWNQQQNVQPLQFNIVPTDAVVPTASYDQGSDPWQATQDMAAAVGYELYFDQNGVVVGKPIPDPTTTPVTWVFTDDSTAVQGDAGTGSTSLLGDAYSTPVEVSVQMTRDGIYNHIVIQGTGDANAATYKNGIQTTDAPVLAEAFDSNPQSPTFVGGAMGDVPDFVESSLITSEGAQNTANNDLQQTLSSAWTATISVPPNPIFDVDQCIIVNRPRVGLNNALVVLDTVTLTVSYAELMSLTGRILLNQPNPVPVEPAS